MVLVLMGVSGSGKTTVASTLAGRLGWAFEEGDAFHSAANIEKMKGGQALTDEDRAPWLEAIASWVDARLDAGENGIITCSALKRRYRDLINRRGRDVVFIFLQGPKETIAARIVTRRGHFMTADLLDSQLADLEPPTPAERAITLDVRADPGAIAQDIVGRLHLVVSAHAEPLAEWRRLRVVAGRRTTVIDLYRLVAEPRGLQPHQLALDERMELARLAMPYVWPGFTMTQGSARGDPIFVVDYDPAWPTRFDDWRNRIADSLGDVALRIEHVGSTAVPGLAAKPIVDIQVSVADLLDEGSYVPALERVGVQLRSRDELHRYFRPFAGKPRDVHVHVCNIGSDWEREHLLFRDYLRTHPRARHDYAATKVAAAAVWADDRWGYTDAKTEVVLDILESAELWARRNHWTYLTLPS